VTLIDAVDGSGRGAALAAAVAVKPRGDASISCNPK
jgi:hypothetical protein